MKKFLSSLLTFAVCSSGLAAYEVSNDGCFDPCYNDCNDACYTSYNDPCYNDCNCPLSSYTGLCGFYVGGEISWALPLETGLGSFTDSWQYEEDGGITSLSKPSKPKYKTAGGFLIGYDFPCSANSFEVEFFYLHNDKHNVNDTSDGPVSFGSAFFQLGSPLLQERISSAMPT